VIRKSSSSRWKWSASTPRFAGRRIVVGRPVGRNKAIERLNEEDKRPKFMPNAANPKQNNLTLRVDFEDNG